MPKMNKLITLGGQHQGIMNVPGCTGPSFNQGPSFACKVVQRVLGFGAYLPWIRSHVIQAQYFKVCKRPADIIRSCPNSGTVLCTAVHMSFKHPQTHTKSAQC